MMNVNNQPPKTKASSSRCICMQQGWCRLVYRLYLWLCLTGTLCMFQQSQALPVDRPPIHCTHTSICSFTTHKFISLTYQEQMNGTRQDWKVTRNSLLTSYISHTHTTTCPHIHLHPALHSPTQGNIHIRFECFWAGGPSGDSSHRRQGSGRLAGQRGASSPVKGDIGIRVVRPHWRKAP